MTGVKPLEERYAYYRRCQVLRKNGEQCKAPAEKGERVCYRHSAQIEAARRGWEARQRVLEDAAASARAAGEKIGEPDELWMSLSGLRWVLFSAARAVADDRIDCATAGRLMAEVQARTRMLCDRGKSENKFSRESTRKNANETWAALRTQRNAGDHFGDGSC